MRRNNKVAITAILVYPVVSENSANPSMNPTRPKKLIEKIKTRQNSMNQVKRIFFSESNNKRVLTRTELIAAFKAILVEPMIMPERNVFWKRISSIPKLTDKAISNMVRIPMRATITEKSRDNILANTREN